MKGPLRRRHLSRDLQEQRCKAFGKSVLAGGNSKAKGYEVGQCLGGQVEEARHPAWLG